MHYLSSKLLAVIVILLLSPSLVHAYPWTESECDEAGGTWVVGGSDGFCFLPLEPMQIELGPNQFGPSDCTGRGIPMRGENEWIACYPVEYSLQVILFEQLMQYRIVSGPNGIMAYPNELPDERMLSLLSDLTSTDERGARSMVTAALPSSRRRGQNYTSLVRVRRDHLEVIVIRRPGDENAIIQFLGSRPLKGLVLASAGCHCVTAENCPCEQDLIRGVRGR